MKTMRGCLFFLFISSSLLGAENKTVFVFLGDTYIGPRAEKSLGSASLFTFLLPYLEGADLIVLNLETTLLTNPKARKQIQKKFRFWMRPESLNFFQSFPVLYDLANNHTGDYGKDGLLETLSHLKKRQMEFIGAGSTRENSQKPFLYFKRTLRAPRATEGSPPRGTFPASEQKDFLSSPSNKEKLSPSTLSPEKGPLFTLRGYSLTYPASFWAGVSSPGTAYGEKSTVIQRAKEDLEKGINPVVLFHWGREKTRKLRPYQRALSLSLARLGVPLVIGHHPHVIQPILIKGNTFVLYSIGNFVFDSFSRTAEGMLVRATFKGSLLAEVLVIFLDVNNYRVHFLPRPLKGKSLAVLRRLLLKSEIPRSWMYETVPHGLRFFKDEGGKSPP